MPEKQKACSVVGHFACTIELKGDDKERAFADFYYGDSNAPWKRGTKHGQAWADTISLAICRAALEAIRNVH